MHCGQLQGMQTSRRHFSLRQWRYVLQPQNSLKTSGRGLTTRVLVLLLGPLARLEVRIPKGKARRANPRAKTRAWQVYNWHGAHQMAVTSALRTTLDHVTTAATGFINAGWKVVMGTTPQSSTGRRRRVAIDMLGVRLKSLALVHTQMRHHLPKWRWCICLLGKGDNLMWLPFYSRPMMRVASSWLWRSTIWSFHQIMI